MIGQTGFPYSFARSVFMVVAYLLLAIFAASDGVAQNDLDNKDVAKSLSSGRYPWYDKASDAANYEAEFSTSQEAETKGRNDVAKAKVAPSPTRVNRGSTSSWGAFVWILFLVLIFAVVTGVTVWLILKAEPSADDQAQWDEPEVGFGSDRIEQLPFNVKQAKGDFLSAAEQAAKAGLFGDAMINLFSHVLLTLDKHDKVRLKRGKTNRQYASELGNHSNLRNYYERVMVFFESTFFGDHEIERQQFESCWNELPNFQQNLQRTSGGQNG